MASDNHKPKAAAPPKKEAVAKVTSPSAKDAPKDAPKDTPKSEGGETTAATTSNYSRGEGQKPVTTAYRENWNAIFAKKKTKKEKR